MKTAYRHMCKCNAKALSREKRQEILDMIHGGKSIKEAAKKADVETSTVMGVIGINLKKVPILNKITV